MTNSLPLPWESSKHRHDVSIIVPTYNRAHYIEECLDSLLNQTYPAIEIIVVDDGSEDDTAERIRRYDNKIRYIKKDNGGKPSAVNLGLSLVQGNLVWLFDDDDVALPHAIEQRVMALKDRPDAGFVYTPYYWGSDGPDGRVVRGRINNASHYDDETLFAELIKGCFFHLASALVRIEAYQMSGGFDIELLRSQDYDIQIRLARTFSAAYSPEPSFIFRQHSGDRGAKGHRSPVHARSKVFQKYDGKIGLKLRSALSLGEYLVPRTNNVTSIEQTRQALLARMVVMASKACIAEMFEDLEAALDTLQPGQCLNGNEINLITSSICTNYAYASSQADWPFFKTRIAKISEHTASKQAIRALAKGFFRLAKSYPGSAAERARKLIIAITMTLGFV
ncbi:MAG: glycosyltransferase family 2 protein [Methylophilaceae bacterium]